MKKLVALVCSLVLLVSGMALFAGCNEIGIPDEEGYTIKISYTSEPFAYEDEARWRLECDKLMAILFDGDDPGEAAELGLRP